jgi:hypothetical protein
MNHDYYCLTGRPDGDDIHLDPAALETVLDELSRR